jgi:hypothetical protein
MDVGFFALDALPEPLAFVTDARVIERLRAERHTRDACGNREE